jgi:polysaccharide export outer membrane protein
MKATAYVVILGAAGALALQPALVASAQEKAPFTVSAQPLSDPPANSTAATAAGQERLSTGSLQGKGNTQTGKAGDTGDPALGGNRHPLYRITRSDTIEINFTFSPELSQTITVQPDGFISLRGAAAVVAEGCTIPELQEAIARAYSGVLHEPEVTVTLKDFEKPYFLASGEVARPGKYELRGDMTVNEAIAVAGGFTQQAKHSQVVLFHRISNDIAEAHLIDVKKMLNSRNLREDLHLHPGDFVYVPQSRISKIRKYVPASTMSWYLNPMQF